MKCTSQMQMTTHVKLIFLVRHGLALGGYLEPSVWLCRGSRFTHQWMILQSLHSILPERENAEQFAVKLGIQCM